MVRGFHHRIKELEDRLARDYSPLGEEILKLLEEIREGGSIIGKKLGRASNELGRVRQEYERLSAQYQELEEAHQQSKEVYQRAETRLADVLIKGDEEKIALETDKSALKRRIKDLEGILEEGSQKNEEYRGRIKELEIERRGLMYNLHIAKAHIALGLPQKLGIGKVVLIGDCKFKLEDAIYIMEEEDISVIEQGVIDDMEIHLSRYLRDVFDARVVTIDKKTYLDNKQRIIQDRLKNAEFVIEVGSIGPPHNVRVKAYALGITHDNGHYISIRRIVPEAISEAIMKIVETKRQEPYQE